MKKYHVKTLAVKGKNSPYTISPGIYQERQETQETWDYLTSLGKNVCQLIIEKEEVAPTPCELGNCPIPEPEAPVVKKTFNRKSRTSNQGDN